MPKRTLYQIHLWLGLGVGLLIAALGVSGSALVYRADLERFQTRDWQRVSVAGQALPLDVLVTAALQARPDKVLARVAVANEPDQSVQVFLQKPAARNLKDAELVDVFVDPYRGAVLGVRATNQGVLWWLQDFHYALFSGEPGLKLNGIGAIALSVLALSGPVLWWPGWRRRRDAMRIRARPSAAKWRDLHAVSGALLFVVLLVIGFTAVFYAYRSTATAVLTLASGNAALAPPTLQPPVGPTQLLSLQVLLDAARSAVPGAHIDELRASRNGKSPASVSFRLPGDTVPGRHRLFLDPYSGAVLRIDRYEQLPVGASLVANMAPLHYGNIWGRLTQFVWFLAGLLPAFLFGSGVWLWLRKRSKG